MMPAELLELAMIRSVAGDLSGGVLSDRRPFRAPHHSASMAALVGGGIKPRPGEIALAHNGVLFLDEFPEFQPNVLDALRQPMETGNVVVARANHRITYPARFQLIAAMNPCKCGRAGEPGHACRRGARCAEDYQARLSGPLLDRIDLHLDVPAVSASDLLLPAPAEGSREIAARVAVARTLAKARCEALKLSARTNAEVGAAAIETMAAPDAAGSRLLRDAADTMRLSARGYHRVLKVARTIADLDGEERVGRVHLAEALSYRTLVDRAPLAA
jgi:magnesium chelatase family protein